MSSIRYLNQSAPFWDFIASLEDQVQNTAAPFFAGPRNGPEDHEPRAPWGWGPPSWHRGPMPHHPHRGGPHHHHHPHGPPPPGPPPPHHDLEHRGPPGDGENAPPEYEDGPDTVTGDEKARERDAEAPSGEETGGEGSGRRREHSRRRGGRCGGRGRWAGVGAEHHGPHGRRGGRGGPWGQGVPPFAGRWLDFLSNQAFGEGAGASSGDETFAPEADVFDTETAFVLHISLPGAKKEDVAVSWDAEKSELCVAGVLCRVGDEAFLKTLAMDGRKVGAFEKKVRLGSRAKPASVDVEGISAKLEDGVLIVEVPKLEGGFVEVRKVDIE